MERELSSEELEAIEQSRQKSDAELLEGGAAPTLDTGTEGERLHLTDEQLEHAQGENASEAVLRDWDQVADKKLPKERVSDKSIDSALDGIQSREREKHLRKMNQSTTDLVNKLTLLHTRLQYIAESQPPSVIRDEDLSTITNVSSEIKTDLGYFYAGVIEEKHLVPRLEGLQKRLEEIQEHFHA
jgi:hypothetical protein